MNSELHLPFPRGDVAREMFLTQRQRSVNSPATPDASGVRTRVSLLTRARGSLC